MMPVMVWPLLIVLIDAIDENKSEKQSCPARTFRSPVLRGSEVSLVRKRCLGFTFAEGGHKIKIIESNVRWLGRDSTKILFYLIIDLFTP